MKYIIILLCQIGLSFTINAQYTGIAMNEKGGFWVLGTDNKITTVSQDFSSWTEFPGNGSALKLRSVMMSPLVVGMGTDYFMGNNGWHLIPGNGTGKLIVADGKSYKYWCIGSDDAIYYLNDQKTSWVKYDNERFKDLAAFNNVLYTIGFDNKIYRSSAPGRWEHLAQGLGSRITTDLKTGTPWCIGTMNTIHRFNGSWWEEFPGNGRAKEIAVMNNIPFVVTDNGSIYKNDNGSWSPVSNPIKYAEIKNGYYTIELKASGRLLDADLNNIKNNGCTVQLWSSKRCLEGQSSGNQTWYFKSLGEGLYQITMKISGNKSLDAWGPDIAKNECKIHLWDAVNGAPGQVWKIIDQGTQGYQIILNSTGKALDAHSDDINKNGCRVQLWDKCSGCVSQMWKIAPPRQCID
jgi:hypothetical protein